MLAEQEAGIGAFYVLVAGDDWVRRVMEEPNGHRAEHVTGGVPGPADYDDRFAVAGR